MLLTIVVTYVVYAIDVLAKSALAGLVVNVQHPAFHMKNTPALIYPKHHMFAMPARIVPSAVLKRLSIKLLMLSVNTKQFVQNPVQDMQFLRAN